MLKKYIAPLIIVAFISLVLSYIVSNSLISDPEDGKPYTYKRVINIRPPFYKGQKFDSLSKEEQQEYFKFRFPAKYFHSDTIETYFPSKVAPQDK